ncbi:MAG: IS21 family transposase [bacterium]|nr:IS21 family transposase [bacterium]
MLKMEEWVTIKHLKKKDPEISLREIGRKVRCSPNTVKRALERDGPPRYERKPGINPKLEPFKEVIFEMANVKKYKGSRILEELRSKGYTGGKTAFYNYLSKVRINGRKHFTPYETSPGEQSQFDWSPYTVPINDMSVKIYVYSYINSFSRKQIYEASLSENQTAVFEALENSLIESEGVPERIQTDNAKVFIIDASPLRFKWNEKYLHFCGHYGIHPSRSLPAHPWSKGKVEKPFSFLETHFIAGNTFESFEDLCGKLKEFQKRVNNRIHGTTKAAPEELFKKERDHLIQLPSNRYAGIKLEVRKVSSDCLISYNGSRYSVPWMFAGKEVWVKVSKGYYLQAYSQVNKLIASHALALQKGGLQIQRSHYRANDSHTGNLQRLEKSFLDIFPDKKIFIRKLAGQKRTSARYHLSQILQIAKMYHKNDMADALDKSLQYNVFNYAFISGYLENNCKHSYDIDVSACLINDEKYNHTNIKRNLNEYSLFK